LHSLTTNFIRMRNLFRITLAVALFSTFGLKAQSSFINKNVPITKLSCDSTVNEEEFKIKIAIPAEAAKYDRLVFRCMGREAFFTKEQFNVYFENKKDTTFYIIGSKSPFGLTVQGPSSVCFRPLMSIGDSTFQTFANLKGQMLLGTSSQWNSATSTYQTIENWDQGKILSEAKLEVWFAKKKKKK